MFYDGSSEMKKEEFLVWKSPEKGVFIHDGQHVSLPEGWVQIPSGDAGLTRRLKAAGEYRVLVHMRRNRMEAIGLWVPEKLRIKSGRNWRKSVPIPPGRKTECVKTDAGTETGGV